MNEHQTLQRVLYFIEFFKDWILGTKREKRWKSRVSYFLLLEAFFWLLPFLNILQPPLLGLVLFFLIELGVLFWAGSLQGSEGLSSSGFGFEKGIGEFVIP